MQGVDRTHANLSHVAEDVAPVLGSGSISLGGNGSLVVLQCACVQDYPSRRSWLFQPA